MGYEEFLDKLAYMVTVIAPLIPIIIGLVQFYRLCGLPSDQAAVIASVITGVVICLAIQASIQFPVIEPWLLAVLVGLIGGMTATGLYSVGSRWAGKIGNNK